MYSMKQRSQRQAAAPIGDVESMLHPRSAPRSPSPNVWHLGEAVGVVRASDGCRWYEIASRDCEHPLVRFVPVQQLRAIREETGIGDDVVFKDYSSFFVIENQEMAVLTPRPQPRLSS